MFLRVLAEAEILRDIPPLVASVASRRGFFKVLAENIDFPIGLLRCLEVGFRRLRKRTFPSETSVLRSKIFDL